MFHELSKIGFVYTIRHFVRDELVSEETARNLVPAEGIDLQIQALFFAGAIPPTWYVGLYEGNYTPTGAVSAATINALATESVAYASATRPAFVPASAGVGAANNAASPANFAFNATKNVYGGFISSSPTKASPAGVLLSVVKFPTVKQMQADSRLEVTAGLTLISA